jgi:hypothetical protein
MTAMQLLNPKAEVHRAWSAVLGRFQSKIETWIDRSGYASESHSPIRVSPEVDIKSEPDIEMKLYSTEIPAYEAHSPVYPRYSLEPRGDSAEAHGSNERKPIMIMRSSNELVIGPPPRGSNEADAALARARSTASNHSYEANMTGSESAAPQFETDLAGDEEFVVESIVAEEIGDNGVRKYLVKWQDYVSVRPSGVNHGLKFMC